MLKSYEEAEQDAAEARAEAIAAHRAGEDAEQVDPHYPQHYAELARLEGWKEP